MSLRIYPFLLLTLSPLPLFATPLEEITVTGSSPLSGAEVGPELPYQLQTFDAEDLRQDHYNSLADLLDRRATGVSVNHAQNNPLQPDLQVRGFSASPLLGAPQGIAAYVNGVRVNEPFGDTINWDLLSASFLNRATLVSGANGAYGLNALGGSLLLDTKTGFDDPTRQLRASSGSFGRHQVALSSGGNNGRWGYFLALDGFEEDGWRDHSPSSAYTGYGALSLRDDDLSWDVFVLLGDTDLHGNGAAPEQLLDREDRMAVFTHPDITENNLAMLSTQLGLDLDEQSSVRGNLFLRSNTTDAFNGDGSEFEECNPPLDGLLCEDDEPDPVEDQYGDFVDDSYNAINNIGEREQESWGATLEYHHRWRLGASEHQSNFGVDFYRGTTGFQSAVEFARLRDDRSTTRSGRYDTEGATVLDTRIQSAALYWIDAFAPTERSELTFTLRYDTNQVKTEDRSGENPALDGNHRFSGFNGGLGLRYGLSEFTQLYGNLSQSSRSPTPVELACSHPDAPCTLPNTFLADPPLNKVVARNLELGLRQNINEATHWSLNTFLSDIDDDIVFQTTGGVSSNEGFFSNASDTRRLGLATQVETGSENLRWTLQYTWLRATFEDDFLVSSPNHPLAVDDRIPVQAGDRLPGLPEHNLTLASEWTITATLSWRWDAHYQSGVYLRGDEGNLDNKTDSFAVLNTTLDLRPTQALRLFLSINNLLDAEYESFGLYGEPDEVTPGLDSGNNRFVSPGEPRGAWLGAQYSW
ncbi:TonB-dependent receptor [Gilvimarinus sp. F26214L]|uniref:TonB-dependent receptor n=1 Tax=Gilvimarinus sp. DZF01 TaxID=3461371 RepID=UPI0040454306